MHCNYSNSIRVAYLLRLACLLINYVINYINKKAFLVIFLEVYNRAILKSNILSSFRATSLVLLDLEVVLLKLKVKPYILTLLALGPTT
jgi:hypothetical protein